MTYFEQYTSNTYAGSGNQLCFRMSEGEVRIGRVLYRVAVGGAYRYSLLFSNTVDSTFADGSLCRCNLVCDAWHIHGARVGKCKRIDATRSLADWTMSDAGDGDADVVVGEFCELTFDGQRQKQVAPGETFASDAVMLNFEAGEYLCLEMTFSGGMMPYHEESLLPIFVKNENGWTYARQMPLPSMIGCDRPVRSRVGYLGDSITQGIGTPYNSYTHWNAVLSERLGAENAYWNLGIGYGRASDAASDGAWMHKAKQNDTVFVCYGVNDILQGRSEQQIKDDLAAIVDILKRAGKRVILQTVPPFDYTGDRIGKWERINAYIKTVLATHVDAVFDNLPILGQEDAPHMARYGGHPNARGCARWAKALYEAVGALI